MSITSVSPSPCHTSTQVSCYMYSATPQHKCPVTCILPHLNTSVLLQVSCYKCPVTSVLLHVFCLCYCHTKLNYTIQHFHHPDSPQLPPATLDEQKVRLKERWRRPDMSCWCDDQSRCQEPTSARRHTS